jgi:hypothetical protein
MDLKEALSPGRWLTGKKHVDPKLILALALVGAGLIVASGWLAFADWRTARQQAAAVAEGEAAVTQVLEPVQSIKRVLGDEQVQALAARAIDNPATTEDLFAYLNGRMSQVSAVRVFPADVRDVRPEELGPNGYALLDMVLAALDGNLSLLQIHHVLKPPALVDAVPVRSGEQTVGVLVATMDPGLVLSAFQPEIGALGYIRLSQYNGSQPATTLGESGTVGLLGDVPDRLAIAGTLFRIEIPRQDVVGLLSGGTLAGTVLTGLLCLAAAIVLRRGNRAWALERRIDEAKRKRQVAADDEPGWAGPGAARSAVAGAQAAPAAAEARAQCGRGAAADAPQVQPDRAPQAAGVRSRAGRTQAGDIPRLRYPRRHRRHARLRRGPQCRPGRRHRGPGEKGRARGGGARRPSLGPLPDGGHDRGHPVHRLRRPRHRGRPDRRAVLRGP